MAGATVTLRRGRLSDGRMVDIDVREGVVHAIRDHVAHEASDADGSGPSVATDLRGWLVLPAMAEPHAHLDKALTAEIVPNPAGDLMGAIEAWVAAAERGTFTHESTVARATEAMEKLLVAGVTAVRTHANVSEGAPAVHALVEARRAFEGLLHVEIVALTHSPMTGSEGAVNRRALDDAIEAGVDLVGGCPHLDPDPAGLISHGLAVAAEAGLAVDFHVDEMLDPSVLTLRELARQVIDSGFEHAVAASHCVTLGMQSAQIQAAVAAEVAEARIAVFPLPQTNLFLQGRDHPTATPRGLTAVQALLDAGVLVAAGADNVQDPFNLVGRSDPLETAALMVMAGHRLPDEAYELVSGNVRAALGLAAAGPTVGAVADLVAIDAESVRAAIADAPMSRRVFKGGCLVASTDQIGGVHRT